MNNDLIKYINYVPYPEDNSIRTIEEWMDHFNCISFQFENDVDTNKKYNLKEFKQLIPKLKYSFVSDI